MENKIQIGILEDHIATSMGYKTQLEANPRLVVTWSAMYYHEVESNISNQTPDLLILDVGAKKHPEDTEPYPILYEIPKLLDKYPELVIVIISMHNRPALIKAVKQAGASGYILKDDELSFEKLDQILLKLSEGEIYFSPEAEQMLKKQEEGLDLTKRQTEILAYLASNPTLSTEELAEILHISPSTIRNHLAGIYLKLGVKRLSSAITKARQLGLLADENEGLPISYD